MREARTSELALLHLLEQLGGLFVLGVVGPPRRVQRRVVGLALRLLGLGRLGHVLPSERVQLLLVHRLDSVLSGTPSKLLVGVVAGKRKTREPASSVSVT